MRRVGHLGLICLVAVIIPVARADFSAEIAEAGTPLSEGVPEVAVVRLQSLLNKNHNGTQSPKNLRKRRWPQTNRSPRWFS
jgi:hypothetical protein